MLPNRDEAKKLVEKVLSYSKAEDCTVTVGAAESADTRFANNSITTSGEASGVVINISATLGNRSGSYATNETSDGALRIAVARAEELARFAPPDPEYMEPLPPQNYPAIAAFDEATARAGHKEMVPGVRAAVEGAQKKNLDSAGFFEREASALALGNKRGNFGYTTRTEAEYSVTARTPDGTGSGWAAAESHHMAALDAAAAARTAADKAVLSQKPRRLDPGKYTVILEPAAVSEMLHYLFFTSFNARAAEEGRSFFTKKGGGTRLGEKLFSEKVTIRTDPFDARHPGVPWSGNISTQLSGTGQFFFASTFGGGSGNSFLPVEKIAWVEDGVLKNLSYNRYWAQKRGAKPTPAPLESLIIDGEKHSLDDLIQSTERGLLVTHFWYIRFVNPQTVQLTGLTRDGLFLIEKGKIVHPVMNFRWNESAPNVLANVEMMTEPVLSNELLVPGMKVRDFQFSSVSDAV